MTRLVLGLIAMLTFALIGVGIYYLTVINPTLGAWIFVTAVTLFVAYLVGTALENDI